MRGLLTWVDGSWPRLLQSPALPAPEWAQSSNAIPGKNLNLLFFVYFFWKLDKTFKKLQFSKI